MTSNQDQAELAENAFARYYFGEGVEVTDMSGWEYTTPGSERTRKVYVETAREDDGPAPRWTLTFNVRFNEDGSLAEAYAIDAKGAMWGTLHHQGPSTEGHTAFCNKSVEAACAAVDAHQGKLGCDGERDMQLWHLLASLHEWCAVYGVNFDDVLKDFKASFHAGEVALPAAFAGWRDFKKSVALNRSEKLHR